MLKATLRPNGFYTSKNGTPTGCYIVSGSAQELEQYNQAVAKRIAESGRDVPKDDSGNYLWFRPAYSQINGKWVHNEILPTFNLTITFNQRIVPDNAASRIAQLNADAELLHSEEIKLKARINMGLERPANARPAVTQPVTPVSSPEEAEDLTKKILAEVGEGNPDASQDVSD